jgi:tetratricopeptide (TPR) repeat protein
MSVNPLKEALERLEAGEFHLEDIAILKQAISSGGITFASNGGIAIRGNVSGGIISTGNLFLPPEIIKMLRQAYIPPTPHPEGLMAERGNLSPGSRLNLPINAVFTGREEYLLDMARLLLYPDFDKLGIIPAVVCMGIGGVGKTQLAAEFCYRFGRFFHGVHWLQANQDMLAEIAECGRVMAMSGRYWALSVWPNKLPDQVEATLSAWKEGGKHLIILDNVEDLKVIQDWLPKLLSARLLITSRSERWPPDMGLVDKQLDILTRAQSIELLYKLAPRLKRASNKELDKISNYLGDLPLALDLAGRYLGEVPNLAIESYIEELNRPGNSLKHRSLKDWVEHSPTKHATSLAATFALSWDRLGDDEIDILAQKVFRACGYCAPNTSIPQELLRKAIISNISSEVLDLALKRLFNLGLAIPLNGMPALHPLIAEFARLQDKEQTSLLGLADAMRSIVIPANESGLPDMMRSFREHLQSVAQAAEDANLESAGALWNELGYYLGIMAEYGEAKKHLERALEIDKKILGLNHPNVAKDTHNLGWILKDQGDLKGAKRHFETALKIDEKVLGSTHPNVGRDANSLGLVLKDTDDLKRAKKYFEKALKINEKNFGSEHWEVAKVANSLGFILKDTDNLKGAKEQFERALKIDEKNFGLNHPNVAKDANNLGLILKYMGDLKGAKEQFERALKIDETIFGLYHPNVASVANNLGLILKELGDSEGTKKCLERALEIDEKIFGSNHPNVASMANNLGLALRELGDLEGAKKYFGRALEIDEAILGSENSNVAIDLANLGRVLKELGDQEGAKKYLERALEIDKKIIGSNLPPTISMANNLDPSSRDSSNPRNIKKRYEQAFKISEEFDKLCHLALRIIRKK